MLAHSFRCDTILSVVSCIPDTHYFSPLDNFNSKLTLPPPCYNFHHRRDCYSLSKASRVFSSFQFLFRVIYRLRWQISSNEWESICRSMGNMTLLIIHGIILLLSAFVLGHENCPAKSSNESATLQTNQTLSRKKRYLAFPSGSAFVTTITLLKAIQVKEPTNWNLDLEFDMIWPIPNQGKPFRRPYKRIQMIHRTRRHKRDLYAVIELGLSRFGLPGKECVLRMICEANTYLNLPGVSVVEDLLRIVLSHEDSVNKLDQYDVAYRKKTDCGFGYPCPISILELLLNYGPHLFV